MGIKKIQLVARVVATVLLSCWQFSARADGLSDLRFALGKLSGDSDLKANYLFSYTNTRNEGGETRVTKGKAGMLVENASNQLTITYEAETMRLLESEANLKVKDEDAQAPTLLALSNIDADDVNRSIKAASGILRTLKRATFISEEVLEKDGRTLRQLNFSLPLEALITDKQTRSYVTKFENVYQILINDDGLPVESHLTYEGKGRAFIILRVKVSGESHSQYEAHDSRLVRTHSTAINRWDSIFGSGEQVDSDTVAIIEE
jgi:hypothetical protein